MHQIQEKILRLMGVEDISTLALRAIAGKIDEAGSPQKIKHHLDQLAKRGLIIIDKRNNTIKKVSSGIDPNTNLISLPILGSANCGEAAFFADNRIEGYLKVSKNVLGDLASKIKNLFVLRVIGSSMNRANLDDNIIESGDYVIVDKEARHPQDGDYVVSVIDGVANIKRIYSDKKNKQLILASESTQETPPIYIHENDMDSYTVAGTVVKVMKKPDEMAIWQEIGARDILKELGPISKEEYDYYENLCSPKEK